MSPVRHSSVAGPNRPFGMTDLQLLSSLEHRQCPGKPRWSPDGRAPPTVRIFGLNPRPRSWFTVRVQLNHDECSVSGHLLAWMGVTVYVCIRASQRTSRLTETIETISQGGDQMCGQRDRVFSRAAAEVHGALRATRAAADAAMKRARRFFFRDAG